MKIYTKIVLSIIPKVRMNEIYIDNIIKVAKKLQMKISVMEDDIYINLGTPQLIKDFIFWFNFLILGNKMNINVTCILSCHNEYENIPILVNDILKNKLNNKIKFILVENGSNDGSKELFKNLNNKYKNIKFVINENNLGWGNGIKYGLKHADTEIVGWMHSDLEYDINILDKVLEVININNLSNFDAFLIKVKELKDLSEKRYSV